MRGFILFMNIDGMQKKNTKTENTEINNISAAMFKLIYNQVHENTQTNT